MVMTTYETEQTLRTARLRVTRPRAVVYDAVQEHPHADAETIVDAARQILPDLSRQAVHDSLRALVDAALVRRLQLGPVARYEARVGDNHHHVVCRACGRIADVDCTAEHVPCMSPSDDHGFLLEATEVVYRGLCPDCADIEPPTVTSSLPSQAQRPARDVPPHEPPASSDPPDAPPLVTHAEAPDAALLAQEQPDDTRYLATLRASEPPAVRPWPQPERLQTVHHLTAGHV